MSFHDEYANAAATVSRLRWAMVMKGRLLAYTLASG